MSSLSSIFSAHKHTVHSMDSASQNSKADTFEKQILFYLQPIITICRAFGVFPFELVFESDSLCLKHNRRWWFFYSFLIWLIGSCYMIFHAVSLVICTSRGDSIIQLTAQSLWINSAVIAYVVSIFMLLRGHKLVELFEEWCNIEKDLNRLFCPIKTKKNIRRFQKVYFFLAVLSNVFCVYHVVKQPMRPVYPFYYLKEEDFTKVHHISYTIFQMLTIGWVWTGYIVLEGTCCFFATVLQQCMQTVMAGLDCNFTSIAYTPTVAEEGENEKSLNQPRVDNNAKFSVDLDHILRNIKNVPSKDPFKTVVEVSKINKEEYLIFAVRKLQTIASLQSKVNAIIGPLLFLDVGQLVLLSCALTFLPIRFTYALDIDSTIAFIGNSIAVFARLIIVIVCLGNVFSTGQDVNIALAKAMTSSSSLSTKCQNPILAHLSVYSANPVCFTAWGFFSINRGTLLAAFSLISTYAVVFFQLKV